MGAGFKKGGETGYNEGGKTDNLPVHVKEDIARLLATSEHVGFLSAVDSLVVEAAPSTCQIVLIYLFIQKHVLQMNREDKLAQVSFHDLSKTLVSRLTEVKCADKC